MTEPAGVAGVAGGSVAASGSGFAGCGGARVGSSEAPGRESADDSGMAHQGAGRRSGTGDRPVIIPRGLPGSSEGRQALTGALFSLRPAAIVTYSSHGRNSLSAGRPS